MQEKDIDAIIDFSKIGIVFQDKPLIVGGLAMEYHGVRKHGDDIDFIVSNRDYKTLRSKYPHNRKDMWGYFGIKANGFEMFRSIYRFEKLFQNKTYKAYLDAHVDRYLAVPGGTILNGDYDDDQ